MRPSYRKTFPALYKRVKTTHTQVLLWDTIVREATETEQTWIMPRKILDTSREPYRIYPSSAPEVAWSVQ